MSRPYQKLSLAILDYLAKKGDAPFGALHKAVSPALPYKEFYNTLFRMNAVELIEKKQSGKQLIAKITEAGKLLLVRKNPTRDGKWKLVIFDVPEKHKKVRNILRAKLKQLHFKKWQNSIWASPYALDPEIESEFKELGEKFFIRLIKTSDINNTGDLEKLFP